MERVKIVIKMEEERMGMPLELNTMIVTKGNEKRIRENDFILVKKDYRLYPIEVPIEVRKTMESESTALAVITKLEWENNKLRLLISSYHSIQQIREMKETALVNKITNAVSLFIILLSDRSTFFANIRGNIREFSEVCTEFHSKFFCFFFICFLIRPCLIWM